MKKFLVILTSVLVFSCQKKEEKKVNLPDKEKSKFEMYQMSEMATLMEQMYVDNQRLKERIIKKDTLGKFPTYFLKIHSAKFTDETDNDAFFKSQANKFIASQKLIYQKPEKAKENFNNGVNACLCCHEKKCGGPIVRIKKLFIE